MSAYCWSLSLLHQVWLHVGREDIQIKGVHLLLQTLNDLCGCLLVGFTLLRRIQKSPVISKIPSIKTGHKNLGVILSWIGIISTNSQIVSIPVHMKSVYKHSLLLQQGMFKKRTGYRDLLTTVSSFLGMIWRINFMSNMSWSALCWVRGRQLLSFFLLLDTTSSKDFIASSETFDTSWCNVPLKDNCTIATSKILSSMVNQMKLVNSFLQSENQNPDFYSDSVASAIHVYHSIYINLSCYFWFTC